jgi:hypothetical protein
MLLILRRPHGIRAMSESSEPRAGRELTAEIERQKRELQASITEAKRLIEQSQRLLSQINEQQRRGSSARR